MWISNGYTTFKESSAVCHLYVWVVFISMCLTFSIKVTTRRPTWPITIQNLYRSVFKSVESYLHFHSCNCWAYVTNKYSICGARIVNKQTLKPLYLRHEISLTSSVSRDRWSSFMGKCSNTEIQEDFVNSSLDIIEKPSEHKWVKNVKVEQFF